MNTISRNIHSPVNHMMVSVIRRTRTQYMLDCQVRHPNFLHALHALDCMLRWRENLCHQTPGETLKVSLFRIQPAFSTALVDTTMLMMMIIYMTTLHCQNNEKGVERL